jgi:hypothetical protein
MDKLGVPPTLVFFADMLQHYVEHIYIYIYTYIYIYIYIHTYIYITNINKTLYKLATVDTLKISLNYTRIYYKVSNSEKTIIKLVRNRFSNIFHRQNLGVKWKIIIPLIFLIYPLLIKLLTFWKWTTSGTLWPVVSQKQTSVSEVLTLSIIREIRWISPRIHRKRSQKIVIFILDAVKAWHLT